MSQEACTPLKASDEDVKKAMVYQNLGRSGLRVSRLSFGAWVTFGEQVGVDLAFDLMKKAYDCGVNFFDNAETYASGKAETVMGEAIKRGISENVWERSDICVTTKIFFGTKAGPNARGCSRKHIVEGLKASLERFQLDYVDVVFCHRPDPLTPIEETVRAMNFCIDQGQAFYWGTSEWSAQQITEAWGHADRLGMIGPICEQPQYNMFERHRVEIEYAPLYKNYDYGLTTWSPLASGILTGKYSGGNVPEGSRLDQKSYTWLKDAKLGKNAWQIERADHLVAFAKELGCTPAQLAIAWCLKNQHVSTVLLGASKMHQLEDNLASIMLLDKITPELLEKIEAKMDTTPEEHSITKQAMSMRT